MIEFKKYYNLLNEGGAVKHMPHPFDLPGINTGRQLLNLFDKIIKHINKVPPSAKLDGINTSVRLIEGPNGLEWAMDRGSMKQIDLDGITIDKLKSRWPDKIDIDEDGEVVTNEHGMVASGKILLSILNAALPEIEKEIRQLKLDKHLDGHNAFFLNTEFVEQGGNNVVPYGKNFIAFHGVNRFEHVTKDPASRRGVNRRESSEVAYNEDALNRLIEKVKKHSLQHDKKFDTHGPIPVKFTRQPNFTNALNSKIEIRYTDQESTTNTLQNWLLAAHNPVGKKIKMNGILLTTAMEKKVYQYVIGENNVSVGPLSDVFEDKDVKTAIDAAIFWHATRLLGMEVNSALETEYANDIPVGEGIVIRGLSSGSTRVVRGKRVPVPYIPFKLTGEFIVSGLQSRYR